MAQKEIVSVLKIETGQSENTIKALKTEIAQLKKALETAEIGSEEFAKASKDLATAQANLKTIMADGKKTTDAVEGSYNHLVATMAELKKAWKATADEAKRNEIGQQIDVINTKLKEMDATIGNHQRNVGNYKGDIIEAFDEMGGGVKSYGERWSEMQKSTEQTRAKFESVQKMASGLASGFAAVQGAAALFGAENENLQKTLVKVQSAMAIAQGIGGLKDFIEGFTQAKTAFQGATMGLKTFTTGLSTMKKALISTGIGALVVAIGTLIAYKDEIGAFFDSAANRANNLDDKIQDLNTSWNDLFTTLSNNERWWELEGLSDEEIALRKYNQALEQYNANAAAYRKALGEYNNDKYTWYGAWREDEYNKLMEMHSELEKERLQVNQLADDYKYIKAKSKKDKEDKEAEEARRQKEQAEAEAKKAQEKAAQATQAAREKEAQAEQAALQKAMGIAERARKSLIDTRKEELDEQKRIFDEEKLFLESKGIDTAYLVDENRKKVAEINKKWDDKEKADREKAANDIMSSLNSELDDISYNSSIKSDSVEIGYSARLTNLDENDAVGAIQLEIDKTLELQAIKEQAFNDQMAQIQAVLDAELENDILTSEQEAELQAQYNALQQEKILVTADANNQIAALNKQLVQQQKADNRELAKNITSTFTSALNAASNILSAVQEGIDTTNKEGFEKNKRLQIANATIGMLVGITNAIGGLFTTKSGPWDIALAAIQAAAIATTGGIQIANIKKQQYDGSGSGSVGNLNGAGATPNVSMESLIPINYTRSVLTDTETTELNKQNRVYVVESDISNTQKNVEVKETNSSF